MPLLTAAGAALVTMAFTICYRLMVGATSTRFLLMVVGVPLASSVWALRPQIVTLLFLAVLMFLLVRERYLWVPPLFLLWANVHGAVALGGLVLLTATAVAWFGDRGRFRLLLAITPLSLLLTACTPMGFGLWRFIAESMARSRQTMIQEWQPAYPNAPMELGFWVIAAAFCFLTIKRWRRLQSWPDRVCVAAALVILPLGFRAVRNVSPFLLVAIPAASRLLGDGFRLWPEAARPASSDRPRLNAAILLSCLIVMMGGVTTAWARAHPRLGWKPISPVAIDATCDCPGPIYNRYDEGGFLIWFARSKPVFIDSRQDPYPMQQLLEHVRSERAGDYRSTFGRYGIRCAVLPPKSPTARELRIDGWEQRYADDRWVVLVKPEAR
jgi:hypothetical protein